MESAYLFQRHTFLEILCSEDLESRRFRRSQSWSEGDRAEDVRLMPLASAKMSEVPIVPHICDTSTASPTSSNTSECDGADGVSDGEEAIAVSTAHVTGKCNPCVLLASLGRCFAENCRYCHGEHQVPQNNKRPRKNTRDMYKRLVQQSLDLQDPEQQHGALQSLAARNNYTRALIIGALQAQTQWQ
ncbi:unnamed protein product [Effrenium voratum]|nr:unnamed protein product [Effrenium voratum]